MNYMRISKKFFQKTKYIVYPKLQYYTFAFFSIVFLLIYTLYAYYTYDALKTIAFNRPSDIDNFLEAHIYISILIGACGIFVLFISTLLITNRIAGPIYRINAEIAKAPSFDKLQKIKLRKNDFYDFFADNINKKISNNN